MQLNNQQINEIIKYFETKPVLKAYSDSECLTDFFGRYICYYSS